MLYVYCMVVARVSEPYNCHLLCIDTVHVYYIETYALMRLYRTVRNFPG